MKMWHGASSPSARLKSAVITVEPLRRSQTFDSRIIPGTYRLRSFLQFQGIVNLRGHDRTDSVYCVVSRETLFHHASECANDRLIVRGQLILNRRMNGCVDCDVWQLDPSPAVIVLDKEHSFLFVEREPDLWIGCLRWIVTVHDVFDG